MSWSGLAFVGMQAASTFMSMQGQQQAYKASEAMRKARNTQLAVNAYASMGRINENRIRAEERSQTIANAIQQENILKMGSAEVAAAAAGVRGNSVDRVFSSIDRASAQKEMQRQTELSGQLAAYDAQMRNTWTGAVLQQDNVEAAQPSVVAPLLNLGANLWGGYQQASAAFDRTSGTTGQFSMFDWLSPGNFNLGKTTTTVTSSNYKTY